MKVKAFFASVAVLGLTACGGSGEPNIADGEEKFISDLMAKMTVEDKIGQLNLLSAYSFISGDPTGEGSEDLTLKAVREGQMGALYGYKDVKRMRELQEAAMSSTNKIPLFFGMDVIHGFETTFPLPIAMATSWNPDVIENSARWAAREATALGINWVFSPMLDVSRDPRWGRVSEGHGEDAYLGGEYAKAYLRGYQGADNDLSKEDNVMVCFKHYALYGAAEAGRDYNTVNLDRQTAMNDFMRPYHEAVKAGAVSVMSSFNVFEGIPATANKYLLDDVLRKQWGFDGFVVTDYNSIQEMEVHGLGDNQEVAARALQAGTDMDMVSQSYVKTLKKSLDEGRISQKDIDTACRRILQAKWRLGLFEDPFRYLDESRAEKYIHTEEIKHAAKLAADESQVLLKNDDNILPLAANKRIAVVGPFADKASEMQGAWAMSSFADHSVSIFAGVSEQVNKAGGKATTAEGSWLVQDENLESTLVNGMMGLFIPGYVPKSVHTRPLNSMIAEAVAQARNADVVVACVGEANAMNGEGASRSDITIPAPQRELLKALKATGKPVVILLSTGRPLDLSWESENFSTILCTWNLGDQAGHSIADVLFGNVNPSGRLVNSFPRAVGQLPLYYNHKRTGRPHGDDEPYRRFTSCYQDVLNSPLYPFGYGLSYTTFEMGEPVLSSSEMSAKNGSVKVSVPVANTGSRDGMHTVQLYIHAKTSTSTRPVQELRAFKKISLKAGEKQTVEFEVTPETLSYYNHALDYVCEPGEYEIMAGANARDVKTTVLAVK